MNSDRFSLMKSSLTDSKCRASSFPFPLNCDMSCIHSKFVMSWFKFKWGSLKFTIWNRHLRSVESCRIFEDLLYRWSFASNHPKLYYFVYLAAPLLSVAWNYYRHWVELTLFFVLASTWLYGSMINMSVAVKVVSITWNHTWILDSGRPISLAIVSRRKMSG